MSALPLISCLTFLPLAGGLAVLLLAGHNSRLARRLALGFSLAALACTAWVGQQFDPGSGALQLMERYNWVPTLGVQYHVGVDGLGLLLVVLTALVVPMSLLASWHIEERAPLYFALVLFLEAGLFGTFTALNFFHWFLFWELSLIPAFFLIRLWGGSQRATAATQFFLYTLVGSIALLLAFLAVFAATGKFDLLALAEMAREGTLVPALGAKLGWHDLTTRWLAMVIFAGAFLGFAVKVPLMPFHTWLPATYAEAPIGTTMLLTGLMSKMGLYGFLRILVPIFGQEMRWVWTPLLWLAVITIVFSAGAALAQTDLKRVLAYSSINHLGYCLLGIFAVMGSGAGAPFAAVEKAAALNGVFLQIFNHGITAATLFWFVGMLSQRGGGLTGLHDYGGLRQVAPVFCGLMGIALFSSLGLPGLNGFIGEFLIFKGTFPLAPWATSAAVLGLLLTAVFLLTLLQRVFYGPLNQKWASLPDLTTSERWALALPIALMLVLGVCPQLLLSWINPTVMEMVRQLQF